MAQYVQLLSNNPAPNGGGRKKKTQRPTSPGPRAGNPTVDGALWRANAQRLGGAAIGSTGAHRPLQAANALVQWLLQQAADRVDAAYQPTPAAAAKDESACSQRFVWHLRAGARLLLHAGKNRALPADAALGLEVVTLRFGPADLFGGG